MNTPILDFVARYAGSDTARFHMPGHKGKPFLGCEALDITEIHGADVLYSPDGIIAESENNASLLFQSGHSFYSTEGSSLAIKAMLALVASRRKSEEKPYILAARNAHKVFLYAAALLDLDIQWLHPSTATHLCSCQITPEQVRAVLAHARTLPRAVYLTSPDYLGQTADIAGIARVCHAYGIPLLVDNAHGAYLGFLTPSLHPLAQGADLCCDSAHKTLPVLTGGAYLHLSKKAMEAYGAQARAMLSLFASTSPSYLILQSLDACNRYLSEGYSLRLDACAKRILAAKERIASCGYSVEESEPLKLVVGGAQMGYTGDALAESLRAKGIEAEFSDPAFLVLMASPETREEEFCRLEQAFASLPKQAPRKILVPAPPAPNDAVLSVRDAMFAPRERIAVSLANGRICATPTVSCPPAIPIAVSGERITNAHIHLFAQYGIQEIDVVKE